MALETGYTIPTVDLADDTSRQVTVDREPGQYLGHVSTVVLEDGRTIIAVYPKGHGRGAIVMKRSTDGGLTWGERLPVPENWATSLETPTIHRVVDPQGVKRLILFSGLYPVRMSVSEDDGRRWTPLAPVGDWGGIVTMGSVERLRDGRYVALFHDDGRFFRKDGRQTDTMTLYQTFSTDGGLTWSLPEAIYASSEIHLCEPGLIRSPDGRQLAILLRENRRRRNSHVMFSNDEARTWTPPRELPGALTGDRHTAKYAPDGRLFISFRDMSLATPTKGDWVGWVGTYDDILNGCEGQYRVRLMKNHKSADCAYPGVEVLPDGTFVCTTYGHWVEGEQPFIVSVRFKLSELDAKLATSGPATQAGGRKFATVKLIRSVTDIAHEFTFYFDGRFAQNYHGAGGADVRNWATLHKADLCNANLLILQSGASPCPYLPQDIEAVRAFLAGGDGVLVLGDYALFRDEHEYHLNELLRSFDAEFADQPIRRPLKGLGVLSGRTIAGNGGKTIRLTDAGPWEVLIQDADDRPVLVRRRVGKGWLAAASRSLCGSRPDAKDPINAEWWNALLQELAGGKCIDPGQPPVGLMPENTVNKGGLCLRYSDYPAPYADEIFGIYARCRPTLEHILGVPPAPEMLTSIILLPTGGGGFSSGREIGLGVWWGDFPQKQYGMIELLGHESTHSWVLPFAEPMWNEGLATYVGILLGRELGYAGEADATLKSWLDGARRQDPHMDQFDLAAGQDIPHEVAMGKPMWIFEELRKDKPDVVARYFQSKRALVDPKKMKNYTADDSVAVLSRAVGRDLFPWFQSLGIHVDAARSQISRRAP